MDGDSAMEDYNNFKKSKKEMIEKENGKILIEGEDKVELARQGVELERPNAINLNKIKEKRKITQFEIDNKLVSIRDEID